MDEVLLADRSARIAGDLLDAVEDGKTPPSSASPAAKTVIPKSRALTRNSSTGSRPMAMRIVSQAKDFSVPGTGGSSCGNLRPWEL